MYATPTFITNATSYYVCTTVLMMLTVKVTAYAILAYSNQVGFSILRPCLLTIPTAVAICDWI